MKVWPHLWEFRSLIRQVIINNPIINKSNDDNTSGEGHYGKLFFTVCSALIMALVCAEVLQVNRFLRTAIEGRAFWYYLPALLVTLGLMLGATLNRVSRIQNLPKMLLVGAFLGFLASIIALSVSSLLSAGSISPTINAWKNPSNLIFAAFLGLGWVYGVLAELTLCFIQRGRYWHIGILMLACTAVRLLEMLPLGRLIPR